MELAGFWSNGDTSSRGLFPLKTYKKFEKVIVKLKTGSPTTGNNTGEVGLGAFTLTSSLFDVEDHWISADLRQHSDVCRWRMALISQKTDQCPVLSSALLVACGGTETQLENCNK